MKAVNIGQRRIQHISGAAFVNLPKIWVDNLGAKKGDDLHFQILEDGSLRIFRQEVSE